MIPSLTLLGREASEKAIHQAAVSGELVTLWTFLSQVLSPDHSCRDAVARLQACLIDEGRTPCAPQTGPYCKARQRLPEQVCPRLARAVGVELPERVADCDLLGGRPINLVDGATVSMPDTAENQAAYRQSVSQKPGVGFPIAGIVVLLSLAWGAALDDSPRLGCGGSRVAVSLWLCRGLPAATPARPSGLNSSAS